MKENDFMLFGNEDWRQLALTGQGKLPYPVSGGSMPEGTGGAADNIRPELAADMAEAQGEHGQTAREAENARRRDQERYLDAVLAALPPDSEEFREYQQGLEDALQGFRMTEGREPNAQERRNLQGDVLADRIAAFRDRTAGTPNQNILADEEFREAFRQPKNLNEIMESVARNFPDFNRDFPLLDREGNVNDANFLRFVRSRMLFFEDEEGADAQINYFSTIGVPFGQSEIPISTLIYREQRFFRDKDGKVHEGLAVQLRKELFSRKIARDRDVSYRKGGKGMGDDSNLPGQMQSMFQDNNFTKNLWGGKSLWYWTTETPLDFREEGAEKNKQDSKLGRAIATSLMAYYHLSDFEKLQEMLGKKSSLFNKQKFYEARKALAEQDEKTNPHKTLGQLEQDFISDSKLNDIFARGDTSPDPTKLITYLTEIFTSAQPDPRRMRMIRQMIKVAIRDKYDLRYDKKDENGNVVREDDKDMMQYAEQHAWSMVRWTGAAAHNDYGAAAFDAQSKILNTQQYRVKQASPNRGGAFGNMYNIGLYKALGLTYLDALYTAEEGPDGEPLLLREVLENIARVGVNDEGEAVADNEALELEARKAASYLSFPGETEQNYVNNGTNRWFTEYDSFISAKELHIDGLMKYAMLQGFMYDPNKFGELIQEGFIKPLRYGYSTWKIYFSKNIRGLAEYDEGLHGVDAPQITVNNKQYVFQDMPIAKAMYGNELIDVEPFWKEIPKFDKDGNPVPGENGEQAHEEIEHLIDAKRMEKNRTQVFKQMALGRIAADLYSHTTLKSPYEHWDYHQVEALLAALERIPGGILYDETDLKNTMIPEYFFSHHDIEYLRSIANATPQRQLATEGSWMLLKGIAKHSKSIWGAFFKAIR